MIRLTVICVWMLTVVGTPYHYYAEFPSDIRMGVGVGRVVVGNEWLHSIVFAKTSLVVLRVLAIGTCLLAIASPRLWWPTAALFVQVVVLDAVVKAHGGFANHAQSVPLLLLALYALFWRDGFMTAPHLWMSVRRSWRRGRAGRQTELSDCAVVWLSKLVIIIPYTYVGVNRVMAGGADMFTSDALLVYLAGASGNFAAYGRWIDPSLYSWAFQGGFALVTMVELLSPLLLWSSRFVCVWLVVLGAFHMTTLFLMNIFFWENLVLSVAVFGPGAYRGR